MKKRNLAQLLKLLRQEGLYYELVRRYQEDDAFETNHYMTIRNEKNLYKDDKYLYINMNINDDLEISHIQYIINYKGQSHSFIDLSCVWDIIHLAYDYFK